MKIAIRNQKGSTILIVVLVLTASILLAIFLYKNIALRIQSYLTITSQVQENKNHPVVTTQPEPKFLTDRFPDFDKLTLSDLPNFRDVRNVFDFNGNKLVMGVEQLVEYNPQTDSFIRTSLRNDPDFFASAKIGNLLYISDNGDFFNGIQPNIYVVDIGSGVVQKSLQGKKDIPYDLTNLDLHSYRNDLWISTKHEIVKFDPQANKVISVYPYSYFENSNNECAEFAIFVNDANSVKAVNVCTENMYTYSYVTDKWAINKINNFSPNQYINRSQKDFGLTIPNFYAITHKVNDSYYALTDQGLFIINRTTLPTLFYPFRVKGDFGYGYESVDTTDGLNFIILSVSGIGIEAPTNYYEKNKIPKALTIKLVNVKTKNETDIVANSKYRNVAIKGYLDTLVSMLESNSQIDSTSYSLVSKDGATLLKLNLQTNELELFPISRH